MAIAALAISFSGSLSLACSPREAQFIGLVESTRTVLTNQGEKECLFKISSTEMKYYGESFICPLDIDEVSSLELKDDSCTLKAGDSVSGVLSVDQDNVAHLY